MKRTWAVKSPPPVNEHELAYLEHGTAAAWVDRKIAPLVLACWKAGINTQFSCEEIDAGISFLAFLESLSMDRFATILSGVQVDRTIFDEMNRKYTDQSCGERSLAQHFGYVASYKGKDLPIWTEDNKVMFPMQYIPAFTERLKTAENTAGGILHA
jgi:hypothetical protein